MTVIITAKQEVEHYLPEGRYSFFHFRERQRALFRHVHPLRETPHCSRGWAGI